ncbi:MAG: FUSC family protein [Thermaerobacter sp.]|nr:FUSC family protein [Thermaerobacter sp.]
MASKDKPAPKIPGPKIPAPPSPPSLAAAITLQPTPWPWRKAIGAPIATGIAMGLGLSLGHFSWAMWAFMGAFTSMYVVPLPYGPRARRLLAVGLGLAAAMAVGSLAAVSWWTMAMGLGVVAGLGTFVTGAYEVPLPAGFMFVLVACIAAALPVHPTLTPLRVGFALAGAALAWLVGMAGWGWHPRRPEQQTVTRALDALAAYAAHKGAPGGFRTEAQAGEAVAAAELATAPLARLRHGGARAARLVLLVHEARRLFDALALDAESPPRQTHPDRIQRAARSVAGRALPKSASEPDRDPIGRAIGRVERVLGFRGRWPGLVPVARAWQPTTGERLTAAWGRTSLVRIDALRIALAVVAGTALAGVLGEAHPYWVPLTIAAVLQGHGVMGMAKRAIQRVAGTTVGLALAGALFVWHPMPWATVVAMLALQFLLLLVILTNYGLSVVFITALALVIIVTEVHGPVWPLLWARWVDTLGGVVLASLALWWLWPRDASRRLPAAVGDVVDRSGSLWRLRLRGSAPDPATVARLGAAACTLGTLSTDAAAEWQRSRPLERLWPTIVGAQRLAWAVRAGACRPDADEASGDTWAAAFNCLASAARAGSLPEPLHLPRSGTAPTVREALLALAHSLTRAASAPTEGSVAGPESEKPTRA